MKKNKLLFTFIIMFIVCCGCTNKYTLTYEDDKFTEELIISNIDKEDENNLIKYVEGSEYLDIDDNNSYHYKSKDNDKIYTYDMGKKFVTSPLINTCFENVFVLDEDKYIHIKTDGEFYCENYDVEVYFKTDKKVIYSNSDSVDNNVYKWKSLNNGIELQFSKNEVIEEGKNNNATKNANSFYIRLIICVVFVIVILFTVSYLKNKSND